MARRCLGITVTAAALLVAGAHLRGRRHAASGAILVPMETPSPRPLTVPRLLWRGFWRRCPLCGGGDCFKTFFLVKDRCPRCSYPIKREEGHWIGAIGMNTIVSFGLLLITFLVVFTLTWNERRALPVFLSGFGVALIVPVVFFGPSQTLWAAIDLLMRPLEPADDVDPRWIPPPSTGGAERTGGLPQRRA